MARLAHMGVPFEGRRGQGGAFALPHSQIEVEAVKSLCFAVKIDGDAN